MHIPKGTTDQLELVTFGENEAELEGLIANITSGSGRVLTRIAAAEKV